MSEFVCPNGHPFPAWLAIGAHVRAVDDALLEATR